MSPAVYACDWVTLISCLCNRLNQISIIIILIIISYTIHLVPPKKWSYKAGNGLYSIELLSTCSSGKEVRDFFSFFFFLSFSFVIIVSITDLCLFCFLISFFYILFVCLLVIQFTSGTWRYAPEQMDPAGQSSVNVSGLRVRHEP